jgi:hypothetical protein
MLQSDKCGSEAREERRDTNKWTSPRMFTDLIFGYKHYWIKYHDGLLLNYREPGTYDCGELLDLCEESTSWWVPMHYALVKDRLFVLVQKPYSGTRLFDSADRYSIYEY